MMVHFIYDCISINGRLEKQWRKNYINFTNQFTIENVIKVHWHVANVINVWTKYGEPKVFIVMEKLA